jgi:hypothetical protein
MAENETPEDNEVEVRFTDFEVATLTSMQAATNFVTLGAYELDEEGRMDSFAELVISFNINQIAKIIWYEDEATITLLDGKDYVTKAIELLPLLSGNTYK